MPRNKSKLPPLSDAQFEVMNLIWEMSEASITDVWKKLSARRRISRSTAQTTMIRLEEKGWLSHRQEGKTFYYAPAAERDKTLRRAVSRLVATAFDGSAEGLVMAMLDSRGVPRDEAARIWKIIENAEKEERR